MQGNGVQVILKVFHWRYSVTRYVYLSSVWDWGTGAKLCMGGWRRSCGRITALAYANAHEHALVLAASHSGALAVFRPPAAAPRAAAEPRLVAAWRALDVRPHHHRPPHAQPLYSQSYIYITL